MQQNRPISNCKYHSQPNNLVIKDEGTFALKCPICYIQCIQNIQIRHKELTITPQVAKPILLNQQSKSFFIEWSQQLVKILTQAQQSNFPIEFITNFIFIFAQNSTLARMPKLQISKMFTSILEEQKDIFKGNVQYIRDLTPHELTVQLFLADLHNMLSQKAQDSLIIIINKFQTLFTEYLSQRGHKDQIQKLKKLQFNINFSRLLIQSKQKIIAKYQKDIFFDVLSNLPSNDQDFDRSQIEESNIPKSYSIKSESIQSAQNRQSELKQSEVIERMVVVGDKKDLSQKSISVEVHSPIKKIVSQTETPKNRSLTSLTDNLNQQETERIKSKNSTAQTKKKQLLQTQLHKRIISEQNQMSQDLQYGQRLVSKDFNYSHHSQNITKLSQIIDSLNSQNKKLKNWKDEVVLQTTNFNNKMKQVTEMVKMLRQIDKKQKQIPQLLQTNQDDQQKMISQLIQQYQQLQSKYQSIIQQLIDKNKEKDFIKNQNMVLKQQNDTLNQKLKQKQHKYEQILQQKEVKIKQLNGKIQQLDDNVKRYKQKIGNLKKQSEIFNIKISQQENEKLKNTLRQLEQINIINNEYLSIVKEKSNIIEQMQQRYSKQIQSLKDNLQKRLGQKQKAWQLQKLNLKQINIQITKELQDQKQKMKKSFDQKLQQLQKRELKDQKLQNENKETQNNQRFQKYILQLQQQLKVQRQKLRHALQITKQLVNLDKQKQFEIDKLKLELLNTKTQIQTISSNLIKAQNLIKQLQLQAQNSSEMEPRNLIQAKQSQNQFLSINAESREKESMFNVKQQSASQIEQRISSLQKKVIELEQQLKSQSISYNDSLIQDLIETESQVKAKQFQINKFVSLINEILAQLPESQRKKYFQKLSILHS